jgi:MoxR-like ATPase
MSDKAEKQEVKVKINEQELKFNIQRLSAETDKMFQKQLSENMDKLSSYSTKIHNEVKSTALNFDRNIKDVTAKNIDYYEKQVKKHLETIKDDLIAEIEKGRSVININANGEVSTVHVGRNNHPEFENVIQSLMLTKKAMLVGPAGTGKTYMINEIAQNLKLPFYKYSCSKDSSVHDLLGYKQPTSEKYLETVFLNAYENGGVFLVDEYDAMSGDMSLFFNGVADSSKFISVPHRDDKPIAEKHKDFYLVMCGNTWGKGSYEFSGRDFQDQALMDRFRLSRHFIDYHIELEKSMCRQAELQYGKIRDLREKLEKVGSYLSTRNVEDICTLMQSGKSFDTLVQQIASDLSENEKNQIL